MNNRKVTFSIINLFHSDLTIYERWQKNYIASISPMWVSRARDAHATFCHSNFLHGRFNTKFQLENTSNIVNNKEWFWIKKRHIFKFLIN